MSHTFTRFLLRLALRTARLHADCAAPAAAYFIAADTFDPAGLPTVMRKAPALAAPLLA